MGTLFYGSVREPIRLPDVLLAYLQVITVAKLRRNEAFFASWRTLQEANDERLHLWLHPSIPLRFVIDVEDGIALQSAVVEQLMRTAATSTVGIDLDIIPQTSADASVRLSPASPGS
ncbi:hypothetical protein OVA26_02235 [Microbacterium sp. SL62]|uniref:DUF7882 family protein n=1 Tax=Microbacterium sp. SL62 TaxID=2995139 RepID=UPI0022748B58|nr:hypothetical protein [Microbacterium sp. SL62]MCY1715763.1 hypothetical protein [Microbacterium sp. SL62]